MRMLLSGLSAAVFALAAWGQPLRVAPPLAAEQPAPRGIENVNSSVVLEASKSAREDLKSIMAQVKAAKARQQQLGAKPAPNPRAVFPPASAGVVAGANPCAGEDVASWRICIDRVHAKLDGLAMESGDKADIDQQIDALRDDFDSMSEMGEMKSLKLQMTMDRLSRMQSTISNVMKKASDTSSSVIQNTK